MRSLNDLMISPSSAPMGRPRINREQTPARFPNGTLARIDAALNDGEKRADFIRKAVERELAQREKPEPSP